MTSNIGSKELLRAVTANSNATEIDEETKEDVRFFFLLL